MHPGDGAGYGYRQTTVIPLCRACSCLPSPDRGPIPGPVLIVTLARSGNGLGSHGRVMP